MKKNQLEAEIARCHKRLEITHLWHTPEGGTKLVKVPIPMSERAEATDGIACRDETIKLLQNTIEHLRADSRMGSDIF